MKFFNKTKGLMLLVCFITLEITACGSNNNGTPTPPDTPPSQPAPDDVSISGVVQDGEISGGTVYFFNAEDIEAVLDNASEADDRASSLASAGPIATESLGADSNSFNVLLSGELAGEALVVVYDNTDAEDETFGTPLNLLSAFVLGDAGAIQTVNLTTHTTLAANQVLVALDPDGDGAVISAEAFASELESSTMSVLMALGSNDDGVALLETGIDPQTAEDSESIEDASAYLGQLIRNNSAVLGADADEVLFLLAADAADGVIDGVASVAFDLDQDELEALEGVASASALGRALPTDMVALSCSASASALRRACDYESLDDYFEFLARCADTSDQAEADECEEQASEEFEEVTEECELITDARQELCVALNDEIHDPDFGAEFANNFVDPLAIGNGVTPNNWLPLVQGNVWTYEGSFEEDGEFITETIVVTVTNKTKLIDGVTCLVVNDVVTIDGLLVEDTDDWFAQDLDGNVWYCGEIAQDFEFFEGDNPFIAELVAIDGSFKAGRDGDEAGILLPNVANVGDIFRQEVSVANAEDTIEILAVDATESSLVVSCTNECLQTFDYSPLDPEALEHKFYAPGIGMIVEIDLNTGDRVELIDFTQTN